MADGKWIEGLTAATPLEEAARMVLGLRLEGVDHFLPLALAEPFRDVEHVHQLRVGTRRATAALRIFADCLHRKVYNGARRCLRVLRRAAGQARDWDVFLKDLEEWQTHARGPRNKSLFLPGYAWGQRLTAQERLEHEAGPLAPEFGTLRNEVLEALGSPKKGATLGEWARPVLLTALQNLQDAAAGDLEDYSQLHQVRIRGKRLRYGMEVFADCFEASFRDEIYPTVEELQGILGRANDSHVAIGHLTQLREALRAARSRAVQSEVAGFLRHHQSRLRRERQQFLRWLKRWQTGHVEKRLIELLEAASGYR